MNSYSTPVLYEPAWPVVSLTLHRNYESEFSPKFDIAPISKITVITSTKTTNNFLSTCFHNIETWGKCGGGGQKNNNTRENELKRYSEKEREREIHRPTESMRVNATKISVPFV